MIGFLRERLAPAPPAPVVHVSCRYTITDSDNETIAHCAVINLGGTLYLTDVYTDPEHRRKGHAAALVRQALEHWRHVDLYLQVAPYADGPASGADLAAWYGRLGFCATTVPGVMVRKATIAEV